MRKTQHDRSLLLEVVYLVRYRFILLVFAALIGGIAGVLFAYLTKVKYIAVTTFALEDEGSGSGGGIMGLASQFGFDLSTGGSGIFSRDNITELLRSRRIVESTLLSPAIINDKNATLAQHLIELDKGISAKPGIAFPIGLTPGQYTPAHDSVMNDIYKYAIQKLIEVRDPDKRRNIFTVIITSPDDVFSKMFSEQLIAHASDFYIETKTKRAKLNVDILQNRVDSLRKSININAYSKAVISDRNINPVYQQSQVSAMLKQSDLTVAATAYGELIKHLEMAKYSLLRQTPLVQIIDQPRLPLEKKGYSRLISGVAGCFIGAFVFLFFWIGTRIVKRFTTQIKVSGVEQTG